MGFNQICIMMYNDSLRIKIIFYIFFFFKVYILYYTYFDKFLLNQKHFSTILKALHVLFDRKKLKSGQLVILV